MSTQLEAVKEKIQNYDFIRFSMCDMNGMYRGQYVAARHAHRFLVKGINLYEGILGHGPRSEFVLFKHEKTYNLGSSAAVPDLDTFRAIPWSEGGVKVAEMLCETRWKKDNSPQTACPRYVARQQIKRLTDLGYNLYSGFEVEFKVFDKDSLKPVFDGIDAYSQRNTNKFSKYLFDFDRNFVESAIDVERYHCELEAGMFEAITNPKHGIESVDMVLNLKQALMEIADLRDLAVSFMSRSNPEIKLTGIGTHFNFSILDKSGNNIFYDEKSSDKLSAAAKHWIAGIMKHSKALCAFTNPTVNCYRRLHQQFFSSSSIFWGIEDREACLRIKNHGPSDTYFESRTPSGKSNPYLVVAATIAAGLDGVEKKLECPPPGKKETNESLPHSLAEALEELEADTDLVDRLGEELVAWFVKCKRDGEIAQYDGIESDWEKIALEREKYFL